MTSHRRSYGTPRTRGSGRAISHDQQNSERRERRADVRVPRSSPGSIPNSRRTSRTTSSANRRPFPSAGVSTSINVTCGYKRLMHDSCICFCHRDVHGIPAAHHNHRQGLRRRHRLLHPERCQNSAMASDQRFQPAASYSLIKPPRIGRRRILPPIGSRTGASGRGGRLCIDRRISVRVTGT